MRGLAMEADQKESIRPPHPNPLPRMTPRELGKVIRGGEGTRRGTLTIQTAEFNESTVMLTIGNTDFRPLRRCERPTGLNRGYSGARLTHSRPSSAHEKAPSPASIAGHRPTAIESLCARGIDAAGDSVGVCHPRDGIGCHWATERGWSSSGHSNAARNRSRHSLPESVESTCDNGRTERNDLQSADSGNGRMALVSNSHSVPI
jgi:hypothetical protein